MYDDTGHLPNQNYAGEEPRTRTYRGPEGIKVKLVAWGPQEHLFERLWAALQATWGEGPVEIPEKLNVDQLDYVKKGFEGRTLGHNFEFITFSFQISGIARACTHQIVRTRIGAGGTQQGGRDNDWRHHPFNIPETVWRLIQEHRQMLELEPRRSESPDQTMDGQSLKCAVHDPSPLFNITIDGKEQIPLDNVLQTYLASGKAVYAALVDAGIPWQDARRFLPIGLTTHLYWNWNLPALIGWCANRLEFIMDWEINCVAQLIRKEVYRNCPTEIYHLLKSHSERMGKPMFADMDLWPPDMQFEPSAEQRARPRLHFATQNPYWVLHPGCYNGDAAQWIPSNGKHPLPGEPASYWVDHYTGDQFADEDNGS